MLAGRFLLITLRFTSIIIEIPASHNENQTFQYVVINLSSCRQCALQRFSGPALTWFQETSFHGTSANSCDASCKGLETDNKSIYYSIELV